MCVEVVYTRGDEVGDRSEIGKRCTSHGKRKKDGEREQEREKKALLSVERQRLTGGKKRTEFNGFDDFVYENSVE